MLYHLRDPITAIERVASVTAGQLILETEMRFDWVPWPCARVFIGRELRGDATNYFAFNTRAVIALLREAGFSRFRVHHRSPWPDRVARVVYSSLRGSPPSRYANRRVVLHAWRD